MKTLITTICMLVITLIAHAQTTVSINDFEILNNTNWEGTLTYLDYGSGNQSTIETTLQIKIEDNKIKSNMQYTYEPHKSNKSTAKIKGNGMYYGNEKIVSNTLENDTHIIVTTYSGKDNGKKADFYVTRTFNEKGFSIRKKVVFKDTKESLIRNTYTFIKID